MKIEVINHKFSGINNKDPFPTEKNPYWFLHE